MSVHPFPVLPRFSHTSPTLLPHAADLPPGAAMASRLAKNLRAVRATPKFADCVSADGETIDNAAVERLARWRALCSFDDCARKGVQGAAGGSITFGEIFKIERKIARDEAEQLASARRWAVERAKEAARLTLNERLIRSLELELYKAERAYPRDLDEIARIQAILAEAHGSNLRSTQ